MMVVLIPVFMLLVCLAGDPAAAATISGTVTDISGKPIKNVRVDHIGKIVVVPATSLGLEPSPDEIRTNADGRFQVKTDSPAIVIRTPGYESHRVRVAGDAEIQITLQRIKTTSRCKLELPPAVKTKKGNDIDYSATWFYIETKDGPRGIIRGSGPSYSWGAPSDSHVRTSVEYFEVMDESGMIDASGHSSDGKYWRSQSIFGAAAQYYDVNRETAEQLDCVMDRVPLKR
jgi:hypothetical protein